MAGFEGVGLDVSRQANYLRATGWSVVRANECSLKGRHRFLNQVKRLLLPLNGRLLKRHGFKTPLLICFFFAMCHTAVRAQGKYF